MIQSKWGERERQRLVFYLSKSHRIIIRPKLKNGLFPAPDRPFENVATRNIFWVICDNFFSSSFWLPEIVIGSSDIVPEFTFGTGLLINEQNPLLDFEGTRFVNELWKKKKSPYLPTHRWNGGSGAGNEHIFKGGLSLF